MRCVVCDRAEAQPRTITLTLERDGKSVVVENLPALVCPNCGETYVDEKAAARAFGEAEDQSVERVA